MRQPNRFRFVRLLAAGLLGISAIRHAWLAIHGDESIARHWLFVAINLGLATLLVKWPRPALYATVILSMQQMYSHGTELARSIEGPGPFDFASLAVCLFFPALIALLVIERRHSNR